MKVFDFILVIISTSLLVVNQVAIKFWLAKKSIIVWPLNMHFFISLFSIEVLISIISIGVSGFLWLSLLKKLDFSLIYPMISLSYILGLLVAIFVFKETVPPIRWIGVIVIMFGIFLISRS